MAFVADSFTDTDSTALPSHTGETGATWTAHGASTGDAIVFTNRAAAVVGTESVHYASGTPASAEYDIEADLYYSAGAGDAAVLGRVDTGANTWYLAQHSSGAGQWRLYKRVAGTWTELGTYTQSLSTSTSYTFKLELRDAAKKVYVGGVERISSSDNAITAAGRVGLRFDGSAGTGYYLDNLSATDALTHYTLSAESNSFALTGQAASLEYGRRLSAESGSFALVGQDATLSIAHVPIIQNTGSAPSTWWPRHRLTLPRRDLTLSAEAGSITLVGASTHFRHLRRLRLQNTPLAVQVGEAKMMAARHLRTAPATAALSCVKARMTCRRPFTTESDLHAQAMAEDEWLLSQ